MRSARYSEASLALSNANDYIREAREISLDELAFLPEEDTISTAVVIAGFAFLFVLFLVILIVYNHYSRKKFDRLMGVYATEIMRNIRREVEPPGVIVRLREGAIKGPELMDQVKRKMEEETVKSLMEKMERVRMFIESIEEEFKAGKISHDSFEEIKSKSEERLRMIKDQLREKGVKLPSEEIVKEVKKRQEEKEKEEKAKAAGKLPITTQIKNLPNKIRGIFVKTAKEGEKPEVVEKKEVKEEPKEEKNEEEEKPKEEGK
jgi:hypothetical protein